MREKGPHSGRTTRRMPNRIQPRIVMPASSPPAAANGPTSRSVKKLRMSPMIVGTRKARIGRTTLGMMSRAGRKVSMTTSAAMMPVAPTGPVERLEFSSLRSRHMRPMTTVAALATMGSTTPRRAARIALVCER